ncbi:hypothetical protein NDU88_007879, partial [Pleurodeles waltl]
AVSWISLSDCSGLRTTRLPSRIRSQSAVHALAQSARAGGQHAEESAGKACRGTQKRLYP